MIIRSPRYMRLGRTPLVVTGFSFLSERNFRRQELGRRGVEDRTTPNASNYASDTLAFRLVRDCDEPGPFLLP